ncbi:MAG: VWA domain-containing protein [Myxococcota bacterium]
MRLPLSYCALIALGALASTAFGADSSAPAGYRADLLPGVVPGAPDQVELLFGPGARAWPVSVRADFGDRVRAEWPVERSYGAVVASLGAELRWPLVTAQQSGAVLIPVVESGRIAIDGRLILPSARGPRRVVVLLDASSSANELASFEAPDGTRERVSVLEAERRALEHLVDGLQGDWLEFGVIAFGESTWPIAAPGASAAELRAALARFRSERPVGEGRTDAVCALWTAWDWLDDSPRGVTREIVVLTDGDAPFSGRFLDGAQRNASACPASHPLSLGGGTSDPLQFVSFARHVHGEATVTPLIFEPERRALPWRQLAERSGGRLVRVPGPAAIDAVLPALVASRIERAVARNATTGAVSGDLLAPDRVSLSGALELAPGPNDVELAVESDRGTAALFRFRIYSAPDERARAPAELRARNRALEARASALDDEARDERTAARRRALELGADPAAPAAPAP